MRFAIIKEGVVVNIAVAQTALAQDWIAAEEAAIGDIYENGAFIQPPAVPVPAPTTCTPAQGLIALYAIKQLTEQDILDAIAQTTDPVQRYTATIGYQRAITWQRGSATMTTMAQLLGLNSADLDALFAYAAEVAV